MDVNTLSGKVVDAAIQVHKALGPGLLESTYERCLQQELLLRGIKVERQVICPIEYRGLKLDEGYRLDLLVEDSIIVELKAVDALNEVHTAQLLTYLKLTGIELGLLINFNVSLLKDGLRRLTTAKPNHKPSVHSVPSVV